MKYQIRKTDNPKWSPYALLVDNKFVTCRTSLNLEGVKLTSKMSCGIEGYDTILAEANTLEEMISILRNKFPEEYI